MTPAGQRWTREKPTEPGWYWWRRGDERGMVIVHQADKPMPWHDSNHSASATIIYHNGAVSLSRVNHFDVELQGPLTPNEATE